MDWERQKELEERRHELVRLLAEKYGLDYFRRLLEDDYNEHASISLELKVKEARAASPLTELMKMVGLIETAGKVSTTPAATSSVKFSGESAGQRAWREHSELWEQLQEYLGEAAPLVMEFQEVEAALAGEMDVSELDLDF